MMMMKHRKHNTTSSSSHLPTSTSASASAASHHNNHREHGGVMDSIFQHEHFKKWIPQWWPIRSQLASGLVVMLASVMVLAFSSVVLHREATVVRVQQEVDDLSNSNNNNHVVAASETVLSERPVPTKEETTKNAEAAVAEQVAEMEQKASDIESSKKEEEHQEQEEIKKAVEAEKKEESTGHGSGTNEKKKKTVPATHSFWEDAYAEEADDPFEVDWDTFGLVKLSDEGFEAVKKAEQVVWRWHKGESSDYFGPPSIQQCHGYSPECAALTEVFAPIVRKLLGPNVALNSINALKRKGPNWHSAHSDFGSIQCLHSVQIWIGTGGVSANASVVGVTHTERAIPGDELMNSRGCCSTECFNYSEPRTPYCSDMAFFKELQQHDPRIRILDGPTEPGVAFLIPGRTYHAGFNNDPGTSRSAVIVQFSSMDRQDCVVREQRRYRERLVRRTLPVLLPIPGAQVPDTLDGILPNFVWKPGTKLPRFIYEPIIPNPKPTTLSSSPDSSKKEDDKHKIAFVPFDYVSSFSSWTSGPNSREEAKHKYKNSETTSPSLQLARLGGARGPMIPHLTERSFLDEAFQKENKHTWASGVHYHEVPEFVYVREGTAFADLYVRGEDQPPMRLDVRQGDLMFTPAGVPHSLVSTSTAFSIVALKFLGRYDQQTNDKPRIDAYKDLTEHEQKMIQASVASLGYSDTAFNRHRPQSYGSPCRSARGTDAKTSRFTLFQNQSISDTLRVKNAFVECNLRHVPLHEDKHDLWIVVLEGQLTIRGIPIQSLRNNDAEDGSEPANDQTETIVVKEGRHLVIPGNTPKEIFASTVGGDTADILVIELLASPPSETETKESSSSNKDNNVLTSCYNNVCALYPSMSILAGDETKFPKSGVFWETKTETNESRLVVRRQDGAETWSTDLKNAEELFLNGNGNWMAFAPDKSVVWKSGVPVFDESRKPFHVKFIADGQLAIVDGPGEVIWKHPVVEAAVTA